MEDERVEDGMGDEERMRGLALGLSGSRIVAVSCVSRVVSCR
jgi:hypothetical protein